MAPKQAKGQKSLVWMQNRIVFPLLFFRSVEGCVFGTTLVKNAPVRAPFLDPLFGLFIQKGREKRGCAVEEVARLAGMEPSAWLAVEAGRVPESAAQLRLMAAALQFSNVQLATIIQICRVAWKA